jgi:hypothetical protein
VELLTGVNIKELPVAPHLVEFREGFGQKFIVTVDTEEEFDWDAPIDRHRHSLVTVPALHKFQQFCEGVGVVPIYLMDFPIANAPAAVEALGKAVAEGRAEIGIQLHPWVSPPFDEEINERNSFAGNLPAELEHAKFSRLKALIETRFGAKPLIYRAGRYGVGPATAAMLGEAGVAIDSSVRTLFDYSYAGGPNFRNHPLRPYWLDRPGGLMELPLTTVYWGMLRQTGPWLYPRLWRTPSLRGALARIGMLERIPLTPEGVTATEVIRGIDLAIDDGLPLLVFSFHSPSLAPGHTPYVSSEADLDAFYDWWRTVFAYLAKRRVAPSSVSDILASVALA